MLTNAYRINATRINYVYLWYKKFNTYFGLFYNFVLCSTHNIMSNFILLTSIKVPLLNPDSGYSPFFHRFILTKAVFWGDFQLDEGLN